MTRNREGIAVGTSGCRIKRAICAILLLLWVCLGALPAMAASDPAFVAGNFWPDVDAVEHGKALRLWMAFYVKDAAEAKGDEPIAPDTNIDDIREGFIKLYANQYAQLVPSVSTDAADLELYLVDSQFQLAVPLSDFHGSLKDLWAIAKGESKAYWKDGSAVDRTFVKQTNPLGVTYLSMVSYVKRIATVTNSNVTQEDIESAAKIMRGNEAGLGEALTGFILMLAPKDETGIPYELEIRSPIPLDGNLKKKPVGHIATSIVGISPTNAQITQVRIKSGVFVDIRLYNGNTQLSFRQTTGRCADGVPCLDLAVYGTPNTLKNLTLGMSRSAVAELLTLNITRLHIRICSPGDVRPYVEYWVSLPLS